MKRILISLALIAIVGTGAIGATRAYFSDHATVSGNTFATGTVKLGSITNLPITWTNMRPGDFISRSVTLNYDGTLAADIYLGVTGTSDPDEAQYFANHLNVVIKDGVNELYNGPASGLSTTWLKIGTNVSNGPKTLDLTMTLDINTDNTHQNVSNTDTTFLFYAIQTGGPGLTTAPYLTSF